MAFVLPDNPCDNPGEISQTLALPRGLHVSREHLYHECCPHLFTSDRTRVLASDQAV